MITRRKLLVGIPALAAVPLIGRQVRATELSETERNRRWLEENYSGPNHAIRLTQDDSKTIVQSLVSKPEDTIKETVIDSNGFYFKYEEVSHLDSMTDRPATRSFIFAAFDTNDMDVLGFYLRTEFGSDFLHNRNVSDDDLRKCLDRTFYEGFIPSYYDMVMHDARDRRSIIDKSQLPPLTEVIDSKHRAMWNLLPVRPYI
jgi:hypothetical protein